MILAPRKNNNKKHNSINKYDDNNNKHGTPLTHNNSNTKNEPGAKPRSTRANNTMI